MKGERPSTHEVLYAPRSTETHETKQALALKEKLKSLMKKLSNKNKGHAPRDDGSVIIRNPRMALRPSTTISMRHTY